jgi:hypothetical protein
MQSCSANPDEDEEGFPCITRLAKDPAVAPIVEDQHAINVFVAGEPPLLLPAAAACCCCCLLLLLHLAAPFAWGSSAMSMRCMRPPAHFCVYSCRQEGAQRQITGLNSVRSVNEPKAACACAHVMLQVPGTRPAGVTQQQRQHQSAQSYTQAIAVHLALGLQVMSRSCGMKISLMATGWR